MGARYGGIQVSVTRPSGTSAYSAGQVVGATAAAIEFPHMGPKGGQIAIIEVDFQIDVSSVPSGMTTFRLHLYNRTPPSALANGAAWDLPSGDRDYYLGYIDIGTPVDVGSTLYVQDTTIRKGATLSAESESLFGYLVTNGGFTPTSSAVKRITLHSVPVSA